MRKMKSSGIKWISNIPDNWKIVKGKHIFEYIQKPIKENDGVITCFRDGEVTLRSNRREDGFTISEKEIGYQGIDVGDLIVHGMDGFAGAIGISDSRGKASPVLNNLLTTQCKRYYMYYLRNMAYSGVFVSLATGIRVRTCDTNWGKLREIQYVVPPIDEQEKIANYLDVECEKIDSICSDIKNEIEVLDNLKKSLILKTITKGLNDYVTMKASGVDWMGDIPAHWDVKRLKFVLEQSNDNIKVGPFGSALSGTDIVSEGKLIYNQRVVLDNDFESADSFVTEEKFQELIKFKVQEGDLLITTRGSIGKVAIVPPNAPEGILHPCIIRFRVNEKLILPNLIKLIFNESDIVKNQFLYMSNSTTIEVIYSYSLKEIVLPIIPMSEQIEIVTFLEKQCAEINSTIADKKKQLEVLDNYKKSLIYEYVTGKKEVANE